MLTPSLPTHCNSPVQDFLDALVSALPTAQAGQPPVRPFADANATALLLPLPRLQLGSGLEKVLLCVRPVFSLCEAAQWEQLGLRESGWLHTGARAAGGS